MGRQAYKIKSNIREDGATKENGVGCGLNPAIYAPSK
jgi:hypothetical protein